MSDNSTKDSERTERHGSDGRPKLAALRDVETVYQPAEDSRLLVEAVIEHAGLDSDDRVVDVGTGSGYIAAQIHETTGAQVIGCDINPDACRQARAAGVPTVRGDLLSPFRAAVFDVAVCNPPYLPTPETQEWDDWMEHALSGGRDGRRIVDRFLADVGRVLVAGGVAYLLVSSLTDPDAVRQRATSAGFDVSTIAAESHPFERLVVLELLPTQRR